MGDLIIPTKLATTAVAWEGDVARDWLARLPRSVGRGGRAVGPRGGCTARARRQHLVGGAGAPSRRRPRRDAQAAAPAPRVGTGGGRAAGLGGRRSGAPARPRPRPMGAAHRGAAGPATPSTPLEARRRPSEPAPRSARACTRCRPPDGLPTLTDVLASWADSLEELLEQRPAADPGLARRALTTMRERPAATEHPVLLHGDLNPTNVLAAEREPWLAIDPKPMVGDPAYDGPRLVTQPDPLRRPSTPPPRSPTASRSSADVMGVDRDALRGVVPGRRRRDGGLGPIARRRGRGRPPATRTSRCWRRTSRDRRAGRALGRSGAGPGRPRSPSAPPRRSRGGRRAARRRAGRQPQPGARARRRTPRRLAMLRAGAPRHRSAGRVSATW